MRAGSSNTSGSKAFCELKKPTTECRLNQLMLAGRRRHGTLRQLIQITPRTLIELAQSEHPDSELGRDEVFILRSIAEMFKRQTVFVACSTYDSLAMQNPDSWYVYFRSEVSLTRTKSRAERRIDRHPLKGHDETSPLRKPADRLHSSDIDRQRSDRDRSVCSTCKAVQN